LRPVKALSPPPQLCAGHNDTLRIRCTLCCQTVLILGLLRRDNFG
jgi:hypothetical protein